MNWEEWTFVASVVKDLEASKELIKKEIEYIEKTIQNLDTMLDVEVTD